MISAMSRSERPEAVGQIVDERVERKLAHEHADASPRLQHAQGFKGLDRLAHGVAADTQAARQIALGRKRIPARKAVIRDESLQAFLH